jgi:hypothetical protein
VLVDVVVLDPSGAQDFQTCGFGLDVGRFEVEVHAVLDALGFGDPLEEQLGAGPSVGQ